MCPQLHGTLPGIRNSVLLRPDPTLTLRQLSQAKGMGHISYQTLVFRVFLGTGWCGFEQPPCPSSPREQRTECLWTPAVVSGPGNRVCPLSLRSRGGQFLLCRSSPCRKPEGTRAGRFPRKPSSLPACSVLELSPSAVP